MCSFWRLFAVASEVVFGPKVSDTENLLKIAARGEQVWIWAPPQLSITLLSGS